MREEDRYVNDEYAADMLSKAVKANDIDLINFMLDRGANINRWNSEGKAPIMYTCHYWANPNTLMLLINKGAMVNRVDREKGQTPLMMAAEDSNWRCVDILLKNGADATIKDHEGKTALDLVKENELWDEEECGSKRGMIYILEEAIKKQEAAKTFEKLLKIAKEKGYNDIEQEINNYNNILNQQ